ncbi:hypothetical protein Hanom_Chr17g01586341 [Helianthus anomalus]
MTRAKNKLNRDTRNFNRVLNPDLNMTRNITATTTVVISQTPPLPSTLSSHHHQHVDYQWKLQLRLKQTSIGERSEKKNVDLTRS